MVLNYQYVKKKTSSYACMLHKILLKDFPSLVVQGLRVCLPMQGIWVNPLSGKIPHAAGQLGPRAKTTEPTDTGSCARQQEKPVWREASARQLEQLQLEEVCAQQQRLSTTTTTTTTTTKTLLKMDHRPKCKT